MLFEVIDPSGLGMMRCNSQECIPEVRTLTSMTSAGFKFKLNGKIISLKKLKDLLKQGDVE